MNGLMVALIAVGSHGGWEGDVRLKYASNDARRVADVFRELGGVRPDRVIQLRDPGPADLRAAMNRATGWVQEARRNGLRSRVVFYYSGHADRRALHLGRASLDHGAVKRMVKATGADQRVLILDACESGGIVRKGASVVTAFDLRLVGDASEGEVVITSSTAGEASLESARLRGSFFTHHFVAGLRGAADAGDGVVSLTEAYEYAYRMTVADTGATRAGPQHPSYQLDLHGMGALVLTWPAHALEVGWLRMPASSDSWMVMEFRHGPALASLPPQPDSERMIALRPGVYWLRRRAGRGLELVEVRVTAGRTIEVGRLERTSVPYAQVVRKGLVDNPGLAQSLIADLSIGDSGLAEVGSLTGGQLSWRVEGAGWAAGPVLRLGQAASRGEQVTFDHQELSLGLAVGLVDDWGTSAVWLGPEVRLVAQRQSFKDRRNAFTPDDRMAFTASYGVFAAWELPIGGLWSLHMRAGAEVVRLQLNEEDAEHRLRSRFALGVGWSLP